ncbi:type VII secretion protein EccB [Streptomyces sparsus]
MASRRDELNAYTFAKKRTVASFLQPSPTGTEEGAPRPIRGFLPGLIIGAVVLAGFGAWGMFKPQAPKGWDKPGAKVIVASDSTTRYVVLKTGSKAQLHPVLNLASARLLLDPDDYGVVKVAEKELDSGRIPHGPTIGIPYAPDRLPGAKDAGDAKRWAVCEQPSGTGRTTQRATFVFADRDTGRTEGRDRLRGGQVLHVQGEDRSRWIVDARGTKYLVGGRNWRDQDTDERGKLLRSLVNDDPQRVSDEWLDSLRTGTPIVFPRLRGDVGAPAGVEGLGQDADVIGTVLVAPTGSGPRQYLVERGRVVPISDFTARLILDSPATRAVGQRGKALSVGLQDITPAAEDQSPTATHTWPTGEVTQANNGNRTTVCSVLRSVHRGKGSVTLSTWAGSSYPADVTEGATSTYVTPGSGLLFRQTKGSDTETGGLFLVTDTGLRYAVQANTDSGTDPSAGADAGTGPGEDASGAPDEPGEANKAQMRLGYAEVKPVPVPANWAQFLPKGPRLDTVSAQQPQGS